jgi:acyl carrier protein
MFQMPDERNERMITVEDVLHIVKESDLPVDASKLDAGAPLVNQGLDSLDMATLMLALESKYKKAIPPEKAARLRTLTNIVEFLNA